MLKAQSDEWLALQYLWSSDPPPEDAAPDDLERYVFTLRFARRHLNRAIREWEQRLKERRGE